MTINFRVVLLQCLPVIKVENDIVVLIKVFGYTRPMNNYYVARYLVTYALNYPFELLNKLWIVKDAASLS